MMCGEIASAAILPDFDRQARYLYGNGRTRAVLINGQSIIKYVRWQE